VIDNTPPFFTPETSAPMMQWGYGLMINTPVRVATECNRALTETDFRAELQRIDVPTLVIHCDKDASAPIALTAPPS
jgi:non-heme chloroperoxidase